MSRIHRAIESFCEMKPARSYRNRRLGEYEDEVVVRSGEANYYLLGNLIAIYRPGEPALYLSSQGWATQLTHHRLSSILWTCGDKYPVLREMWLRMRNGHRAIFIYLAKNGYYYMVPGLYSFMRIDLMYGSISNSREVIPYMRDIRIGRSNPYYGDGYVAYKFRGRAADFVVLVREDGVSFMCYRHADYCEQWDLRKIIEHVIDTVEREEDRRAADYNKRILAMLEMLV